jgi:hypothetical protein
VKLQESLGYVLGNLYLKGIDPNRSQSRGVEAIASLGQELSQFEKPPNQVRFKRDLGQSHQPKRHKILIRDTHKKNPRNCPQNSANKELRKSPQRRTGKTLLNLEEQRRTIYTYHEGSYKI